MKIQILGTGCAKCKKLLSAVETAVGDLGVDAEIEKVEDIKDIAQMGVMSTPALAVDGEVVAAGKVLTPEQIKDYLQ
ncbi:MAG: thioredoxin family protein [Armatimonadota bacterium]